MNLLLLLLLPLIGALAAWLSGRKDTNYPRFVALFSLILCLIPLTNIWLNGSKDNSWFANYQVPWLTRLNLDLHVAVDGLSLLLVALTLFVALLALFSSWQEITKRSGLFYLNFLLVISGIIGVFISLNLLIFFVFWEVMLVPMFFLINIWGHENRHYAALKFLIFTQLGGLFMLLSICGLGVIHLQQTGSWSFDYLELSQIQLTSSLQNWLALGFMLAFLVKLPALPFHSWLPDAHTQAPTGASIILAAVLLKTSAYGIIRFVLVLFPQFCVEFATVINIIAVAGILYGASLAFAQTDLKRLVAYSSISHMGFVLLGCFSLNALALQGAIVQILAHGLTSAGLFAVAGMIQARYATRDLNQIGGLAQQVPQLAGLTMMIVIATLGMPGFGNFVGEFLVLLGSFQHFKIFSAIGAAGLIFSASYCLLIIHRCFWGELKTGIKQDVSEKFQDINRREKLSLVSLVIALLILGLQPQPLLNLTASLSQQLVLRLSTSASKGPFETSPHLISAIKEEEVL